MGRHDRPEHSAPPELFYDDTEAQKYTENSRIIGIQRTLTERALELLAIPDDGVPRFLLDLGCGSGLSGEVLSERGHAWIGLDISRSMLGIARSRESEGDLGLSDLGQGLPIRPGTVDGVISVSAIQWLCNADARSHDPRKRLKRFFETLYRCLARGGRAVLQFYPESPAQATMIASAAMKVGFSGGLVVDYPNSTRAKKHFLVLMVGGAPVQAVPRGLDGEPGDEGDAGEVPVAARKTRRGRHGKRRDDLGARGAVLAKKNKMRDRGVGVRADSKYTGRKRRDRF